MPVTFFQNEDWIMCDRFIWSNTWLRHDNHLCTDIQLLLTYKTIFRMSFPMIFLIAFSYLFLIAVVTFAASNRKIGKSRVFLISVLLTPIAGFIAFRYSDPAELLRYTRYRCPSCGVDFTEPMIDCPYCRRDGEIIKLRPMMMRSIWSIIPCCNTSFQPSRIL